MVHVQWEIYGIWNVRGLRGGKLQRIKEHEKVIECGVYWREKETIVEDTGMRVTTTASEIIFLSLPGYFMVGMIYESAVVGKVTDRKSTSPEEDKRWLKKMERRVGTRAVYSVGRHNCRMFSQIEFEKAP